MCQIKSVVIPGCTIRFASVPSEIIVGQAIPNPVVVEVTVPLFWDVADVSGFIGVCETSCECQEEKLLEGLTVVTGHAAYQMFDDSTIVPGAANADADDADNDDNDGNDGNDDNVDADNADTNNAASSFSSESGSGSDSDSDSNPLHWMDVDEVINAGPLPAPNGHDRKFVLTFSDMRLMYHPTTINIVVGIELATSTGQVMHVGNMLDLNPVAVVEQQF